jgi:ATP-dependent transcriptional regulator
VLDDYHLVTSAQVHATVATLLDRCPPQLHLMLITRADPPLPLSRLRVRGDLAELRAEDLRFSAEAVEFFSSRLGPLLSEARRAQAAGADRGMGRGAATGRPAVARPAGPRISSTAHRRGLAHRQLSRRGGAGHSAPGGPRVPAGDLGLNRICAPLCDALTERADGASLISEIYRANLFLVPLDDEHRWFRYHHLFGGLLRHELARTAPDRPSALHQRAAQWYADHGDAAEAIGHAIASGDGSLSGRLVAAHWRQPFNAGQLETVRMWLDALPAELVSVDASLSAARVWVALDTGRLEEVGAALDAAETSVLPDAS